jgi:hypothetical protein
LSVVCAVAEGFWKLREGGVAIACLAGRLRSRPPVAWCVGFSGQGMGRVVFSPLIPDLLLFRPRLRL